ncbi:MAG: efflux RND transporter periplasmic adaptor subunit [Sandaracinus sp.]|nr:efflux RND transporter periplasmic adaptor subunit [Sandaracinus sp.]MCB9633654.1 efflux RND transporter periplasmic adaptor subunit [Sandaracinus sp.]
MKRSIVVGLVAVLAAFALGRWSSPSSETSSSEPHARSAAAEIWTCSMHPQVRRDGPGTCPFCGMDLVPTSSSEPSSPGEVTLSERARALAAVRTEAVGEHALGGEGARFVARVGVDETRLELVTTWTAGRIDRLHVRATGQRVSRGQVVATIYSPEIYAAHQDLLVAKRQVERASEGPARTMAEASLEASRERLRLLGFEGDALAELERATSATRQVPVRSPTSGTVLERLATQGAYVPAGAPLYRVGRLDRVWAQLEVYEPDLARVSVGQTVSLRFPGVDSVLEGRVAFVDPTVDPRRRVAQVRVEVDARGNDLRPGMVGEAEVALGTTASTLDVPASAILYTGRRSVVYVETEPGTYEARTVRVGLRRGRGEDARVPVFEGLSAGERVVVNGAFVVDAELQIRGGASMMTRDGDSARFELDEEGRHALAPVVDAVLSLAAALAESDVDAARTQARAVAEAARDEALADEAWPALAAALRREAHAVHHAANLDAARVAFEPLSLRVEALLARYGNPTSAEIRVAHCPMAFDNRGARWVQRPERVDNAYFGDAMRTCGTIEATVAPGAPLDPGMLR